MAKERIDRLFAGADWLAPVDEGPPDRPRRGRDFGRVRIVERGAVAVTGGRIAAVGPEEDLQRRFEAREVVRLGGGGIVPGFVDAHTHPIFAGTREEEFGLRCRGADYVEIARRGGGILSSVQGVRAAGEDELAARVEARLRRFLLHGTTTLEAKSGYGLSTKDELKSLRALRRAAAAVPITVSPTFLGAHEVPPEHRADPERYVDLLVSEMLPAARDLADSADAFVEEHVFDLAQGERILAAAKDCGYRLRVHADELAPLGGTELAVRLGAASADHLLAVSERGIELLAASDTAAVLLPGTSFFLRKAKHAPGARLAQAGAIVVLATDFNPGSCYTLSLPMIATLARLHFGFSGAACLQAVTLNAACSLGLGAERGSLHAGKAADFAVLDLPSLEAFGYEFGTNPVRLTVKEGRIVACARGRTAPRNGELERSEAAL